MNRMRFALFCDRAHRQATDTTVAPIHVLVTIVEVEAVRAVVEVAVVRIVRSRTPIDAVDSSVVERRPATVARSREKDALTIWSRYFVSYLAVLCNPFPSAFILQFF